MRSLHNSHTRSCMQTRSTVTSAGPSWLARLGARACRAGTCSRGDRGARSGRARLYGGLWGAADPPVVRERGRLDWAGLAALLKGAAVYVGPDTSVTHLAAGTGCPTIAIYGPTSPRLIGPWPVGGLTEPWAHAGTIQHRGNVWVVQNPLPCLPCEKLGCAGHLDSYSQCLDELSVAQVLLRRSIRRSRSDNSRSSLYRSSNQRA